MYGIGHEAGTIRYSILIGKHSGKVHQTKVGRGGSIKADDIVVLLQGESSHHFMAHGWSERQVGSLGC